MCVETSGFAVDALFEHVLDRVDAAARTVALIAKHDVGRTGRGAEPAMHATPQDAVRSCDLRIVELRLGKVGLHRA